LEQAIARFKRTLEIDSENAVAHYNLALIYERLGERQLAEQHRKLHDRYRPDDNARDRAIAIARRRDPAADHAAQATVIYSLQRNGAPELPFAGTGAQVSNGRVVNASTAQVRNLRSNQ